MKKAEKSIQFGGRTLTLKTGIFAEQATGAVLASHGETVVLATVVSAPLKMDLGYFPLTVDYQERLYAGGRIKGSRWVKREGKPTDDEILTSRLIDRSIRPLFPHDYMREVQVVVTVLSVDFENDPRILACIATSAALAVSSMPWMGPVGVTKVGYKDGAYVTNPVNSEMKSSEMDLVVTSTTDAVLMIEAGAREVSEEVILGGVEHAQKENKELIKLIDSLVKEVGTKKEVMAEASDDSDLKDRIKKLVKTKLPAAVESMLKLEGGRSPEYQELIDSVKEAVEESEKEKVFEIIEKLQKEHVRETILKGKRMDGRKHTEIRPLSAIVGLLPRTHGSAVFARGQTQVLTVATLGAPNEELAIESAEGEIEKRYIHHYNFPPYSTGEAGRVGNPGRREIGHGALAERALEPVIPALDVFPYTIRLVSEVMSSNGSTSMASTCGSTLALMDAGVPLTSPVSGIAMGLIIESKDKYAILTDIMGMEDFNGDMDFKVAGTSKGITALQLDVKTQSLTSKILSEALAQSKVARAEILDVITKAIKEPRATVSAHAPKIKVIHIPTEKIGEVIGPGGRMIKKIVADTGASVEVKDDGSVNISGVDPEAVAKAVEVVESLVKEVQIGEIYDGVVRRIQPFGAFVEILPGKDGLVHVSDMGEEEFVNNPEDVVSIDQQVKVRVKDVDKMGRINLSMNMDPAQDKPREERGRGDGDRPRSFSDRPRSGGFGDRRGGFGGPRRDDRSRGFSERRGGDERRGSFGGGDRRRSSFGGPRRDGGRPDARGGAGGPHFPTSRLMDDNKKDFNR